MIDFADTSSPYQILRDFYIVWLDQIWESSKTKSGIITSNTAIHNTNEETTESGEFKRRYGYVIEVPASFSDKHVEMVDPGGPPSRAYVGHERLQELRNAGVRGFRQHEQPWARYYPSTFERYESINMCDVGPQIDVKKGDMVYMLPTATDMERYLGPYKDGHLFSVQATEIICKMVDTSVFRGYSKYKQKRISPQGRWMFVDVDKKDWKETEIAGIKVLLAAGETLQGQCVAGPKHLEGRRVVFERDADAPVTIEGRELSVMEIRDVLATIKQ